MEINVNGYTARRPESMDHFFISTLLICVVLFGLLPSGFNWNYEVDSESLNTGSLGYQLQWGSIFALSVFVLMRQRILAILYARAINPFLLAMVVYCFVSILWSPAPIVTLKRTIQVFGLILFSLAVQMNGKPWSYSILVMLSALTGIGLASAVAAIAIPSVGIDAYFGYAWRGITDNKNALGAVAALSLLLWVSVWHLKSIKPWVRWSGAVLSVVCVGFSTSSTSITLAALGPVVFWILHRQHVGSPLWLQRVTVVAGMLVLLYVHAFYIQEAHLPTRADLLGPFASVFGKSADLTGRSDIWEPLMIQIEKHWIFGIGYGAFWLGPDSASQPVLDTLSWIPYQGHNGYLDMLNELGAIGMLLFFGFVLFHMRNLMQLFAIDRKAAALFSALLVTILVSNLTESSLFRHVAFNFLLLILSSVTVSSMLLARRFSATVQHARSKLVRAWPYDN